MVEQALSRHGIKIGYVNQSYFVSIFPDYVLKIRITNRIQTLKIFKFARDLRESTIEHVARYQTECGNLVIDEFLKMKYFPGTSLTKNAFSCFTTLPPNFS